MSTPNGSAVAVLCACKYCGAKFTFHRKKRKCDDCKHRRPSPRYQRGSHALLPPEVRDRKRQLKTKRARERFRTDPAYRAWCAKRKRDRRARQAAARGRKVGDRIANFDALQDRLIERNARDAWKYWMGVLAPAAWLDAYWSVQPWRRPGLSEAQEWRIRYQHDPEFRQSERERVTVRRHACPDYAAQWSRLPGGRWQRAAASADGTVTRALLKGLMDQAHCSYCHADTARPDREIDHVWPLARGGSHTEDNLVMACAACNIRKSAKRPLQWLAMCSA